MVICDKHNFIFLRIPKNASSSLADFFVRNFCDQNDIWTEVNDCGIRDNNVNPELIRKYRHQYRFIHLMLQELVDNNVVTPTTLADKEIISVLRNPHRRQLSLYFFLKRGQRKSPEEFRHIFRDGYHETDTSNRILQTDYPKLKGVDKGTWWIYNRLNEHLQEFCSSKGMTGKLELKQYKNGYTPKQQEIFEQYYDQKTLDAVKKYYEKDFDKLMELGTGLELA
jgi:hypothetical protein